MIPLYRGAIPLDLLKPPARGFSASCRAFLDSNPARYAYRIFDTAQLWNILPDPGEDIKAHLNGFRQAAMFAVTYGIAADKAIAADGLTRGLSSAFSLELEVNSAVDLACDALEKIIVSAHGITTTKWRYSPGYGDFPLSLQPKFIDTLEAVKKIGLSVSDDNLLLPRKSVTAIIGLKI